MSSKFLCSFLILTACCGSACPSSAQNPPGAAAAPSTPDASETRVTSATFDASASAALQTMKARAEELKVGGVAVLAYFDGDRIQSWDSKMLVVGRMKDEPTATDKGLNLLAVAYAKAAEMADTLKDSGSKTRPPLNGEFGWEGGVIVHVKTGYLIAAFSGGKSEDDVAVSRAGAAKVISEAGSSK